MRKSEEKVKVGLYLTKDLHEWIRNQAFSRRVSMSEYIRNLLYKLRETASFREK